MPIRIGVTIVDRLPLRRITVRMSGLMDANPRENFQIRIYKPFHLHHGGSSLVRQIVRYRKIELSSSRSSYRFTCPPLGPVVSEARPAWMRDRTPRAAEPELPPRAESRDSRGHGRFQAVAGVMSGPSRAHTTIRRRFAGEARHVRQANATSRGVFSLQHTIFDGPP
jgi:hypothetical protein